MRATSSERVGRGRRDRFRPLLALAVIVMLAAVFLVRLTDVQVVRADALRAQSKDRRDVAETLPGDRGDVLDADGAVLATTVTRYRVTAVPRLATAAGTASADATRIATALHLGADAVRQALTAHPDADYALLAPHVTVARMDALRRLGIGWIYTEPVPVRTYPAGAVAGNLVGFVNPDQQPQAGVEYGWDRCLAGADGKAVSERGADGTRIPGTETVLKRPSPGGSVRLTIDRDLQYYAQQQLAARARQTGAAWGTVVVAEVRTGKLLAVADWPTLDPNHVSATADRDASALGSRAFTAPYEPGSTMKPITASMLLDRGLATPASRAVVPDHLRTAEGADLGDSESHPVEHLTLTGVLVQSSNVGISELGARLPAATRTDYLHRYGFGSATEVGFGAEAKGDLGAAPDWDAQTRLATMFGQGLTTSAVQMASAYQALANGGVRLPLRLVDSCTDADGTVHRTPAGTPRRVVGAAAATSTVRMLENVATKGWLAHDVTIPGYRIGIKTGTAQESDGHGGYAKGYLVSMAGVAPADDPRYVVYVVLDDPVRMNTSQATAPVWRAVTARALQAGGVVPSGSASPDLPATW